MTRRCRSMIIVTVMSDKETVLKNILQTSKKTVIYVNNTDFAPGSASMMTDVQVLAYGEQADATAENIIFMISRSGDIYKRCFACA